MWRRKIWRKLQELQEFWDGKNLMVWSRGGPVRVQWTMVYTLRLFCNFSHWRITWNVLICCWELIEWMMLLIIRWSRRWYLFSFGWRGLSMIENLWWSREKRGFAPGFSSIIGDVISAAYLTNDFIFCIIPSFILWFFLCYFWNFFLLCFYSFFILWRWMIRIN